METPPDSILSRIAFRTVRPTDIPACAALEKASYPPDEAATKSQLQYRQHQAAKYFRCAVLLEPDSRTLVEDAPIVGFVCSTRCQQLTHQAMSTHLPGGSLLAIHSVVVDAQYRKMGIATALLKDYVTKMAERNEDKSIEKIVLLAKPALFLLYIKAGFAVMRPSAVVHGKEQWYELEYPLVDTNSLLSEPQENHPAYWVLDAFADPHQRGGTGNPAAVVPLARPTEDDDEAMLQWMQCVAQEFNLSETAFVWPTETDMHYQIRYFTPTTEVPLCGHATLASAATLYQTMQDRSLLGERTIVFHARENVELTASLVTWGSHALQIAMEFPLKPAVELSEGDREGGIGMLSKAFGLNQEQILYMGLSDIGDLLIEVSYDVLQGLPYEGMSLEALLQWDGYSRGVILCSLWTPDDVLTDDEDNVTDGVANEDKNKSVAEEQWDFCSRFFAPKAGISEDPVTGSAHCTLAPYFGAKLNKTSLVGYQASRRGGVIECEILDNPDRVRISGHVITTMEGHLKI
jgi:predicted PhzF superfamily epimerase YddE/YHI9/ribosomal protein S18 acetylase RimI-like enzyme